MLSLDILCMLLMFWFFVELAMQIVFPALLIRAPKVVGLHIFHHLEDDWKVSINTMGFKWLLNMPHIQVNQKLLTSWVEWWHSEHNTFHLPTGEATITVKDVYHILHIPCHGDPMSMIFVFWYLFILILWFPYEVCWCGFWSYHKFTMIKPQQRED